MKFSGFGYLIKEGIKNIWSNRMMSLASVGVLISCLLLTGAAGLLSLNVTNAVDSIGGNNVTRVFLEQEITDLEAVYIEDELAKLQNVTETAFISKDDAIKEYQESLREDIFEQLLGEGNPLPNAIDVTMADLALYDQTISQIMEVDGVESTRDTREVAEKLTSLNDLVTMLSFIIVVALILISVFIISNTIRMTMYSRRFEISIMKSVGATDTFVRIPFVVEGMTIGLISGTLTSVLLFLLYDIIMKAVQNIVEFDFVPYLQVGWWVTLAFILAGVLIGALGSVVSIGRYLKKEGNELLGW
ncbi:MAG: permease-like cell division protein FtsX [Clostridia bacterium]|nr:permease-like cell division protein FtsX [Clostridia bacterium]